MAAVQMTFKLPERLKQKFEQQWRADGYGTREKSRWLWEAFYALLDQDPALDSVGLGDKLEGVNSAVMLLTGDANSKSQLDETAKRLRPVMETGARALLLRSAIRLRLTSPERFIDLVAAAKRRSQSRTAAAAMRVLG